MKKSWIKFEPQPNLPDTDTQCKDCRDLSSCHHLHNIYLRHHNNKLHKEKINELEKQNFTKLKLICRNCSFTKSSSTFLHNISEYHSPTSNTDSKFLLQNYSLEKNEQFQMFKFDNLWPNWGDHGFWHLPVPCSY